MEKDARAVIRRHAFGVRSEVFGSVNWLDEGTLMYPVGKTVALHSVNTNTQRFLETTYQSTGPTAVALSANKKFVAVAEGGDNPIIQIIDTVTRKRRKVLSVGELNSDRFVALAFSADGRHLVTQGGAPGWNLFYWNWERSKPLASLSLATSSVSLTDPATSVSTMGAEGELSNRRGRNLPQMPLVSNVAVCPDDPLKITVSGMGLMRFYHYTDGVLQQQPSCGYTREQQEYFATHAWISGEHVIAATQRGNLLLLDRGRYVSTIPTTADGGVLEGASITAVIPMHLGFVAGAENGNISIFHRAEDGENTLYALAKTIKVPEREPGQPPDTLMSGATDMITMDNTNGNNNNASKVDETGSGSNLETHSSVPKKPLFDLSSAPNRSVSMGISTTRSGLLTSVAASMATTLGGENTASHNGNAPPRCGYGVAALALDQPEENLAVVTHAGKIYALGFRHNWESLADSKVPPFEPICQPFHSGPVNGLSCSTRKPFLMTSSSDHSVRLWNTQTNRLEICEFFKQEPGAVALHPGGLMAVVCFADKVRVMSVLWNSLRERRCINFRNCTDVQFAHGGQFFALTHGNMVDIFNTSTCEPVGQLRGHPQRIKDLQWCSTSAYPTDNRIVTCSADGMIMDWNTVDLRKELEHTDKRFQYLAVASDDRNVWAVAAPTSTTAMEVAWKVTLREIDRHGLGSASTPSEDYEFTETALSSLKVAPHQRMLFGGSEDGSLKVMTFPLQAGIQDAPITAHAGRITRMELSFDENLLFTAGADGSFMVWDVREDGRRKAAEPRSSTNLTDEVLVTQREIEEQTIEIESLQQQIDKIKTDIDSEEKRRNHEQNTRVRERAEEFKSDTATLAAEYAGLWNAKADQERSFVAIKLEKESEGTHNMEQLERSRQEEVQRLEEECSTLQLTLEREKVDHAESLEQIGITISKEQTEDETHFNEVLKQRRETLEKLARQVERSKQTNMETQLQLELDTDAEAQAIFGKHQSELTSLRERFLHMKGEGAIMRKNAVRMEKEIEVRTGEIRLLDSAKTALNAQLADLSHRMSQLHQDIDERDAIIGEKEKKIYALKKQNQELEKHKFVLDHRIRQLKAQMEPKQREIVMHNQKIKQKNNELEALHESNVTLRGNIDDLKQDLTQQQQHIKQLLSRIKDFDTYMTRFQKDVGDLAPALQEPVQLRDVVQLLFDKHVTARGGQRIAQSNPQIRQEFHDQLEYLSTSVEALRRKVKADQSRHRKEVSEMMMENLALIREINDLRHEIQNYRIRIAADEAVQRAQGGGSKKGTVAEVEDGTALGQSATKTFVSNSESALNPAASSSQSKLGGSVKRVGSRRLGTPNSGAKAPPAPPKTIEENRAEIRMQRAYIEAMQSTLADAQLSRPTSSASGRLPPIS